MHAITALALALTMLAPAALPAPVTSPASAPTVHAATLTERVNQIVWRFGIARINVACDAFASATTSAGTASIARTVTVGDHATIILTVCSNGTTGFAWETPTHDPTHLRLVFHRVNGTSGGVLGAAGTETFVFRVRHAGTSTLRFAYSQPWSGGAKSVWTYALTVDATTARPAVAQTVSVGCDAFTAPAGVRGSTAATTAAVTRTVTARVGGTLVVRLCSNPTTGFSWEQPSITGASVQLASHATIAPDTAVIGAAGTETWTFRVVRTGTSTVHFAYSRPWAGGEKGIWTVDLTVLATD